MDDIGGYEFEPASGPIAKEFQCIICQFILKDTKTLPCSHGFCSTCLYKWEQERLEKHMNLQCPTCNAGYKQEEVQSNTLIDRFITTSLDVKCYYHDDGCEWEGKIIDYKVHKENNCQHTRLECTNAGCEELVIKSLLNNHVTNECIFREIQCQACETMQVYHSLEAHFQQCPFYQIKCPNEGCEQVIERNQMTNHLRKDCFFHMVSCEYAIVGCKQKFLRQEQEEHMSVNSNYHMSLVLKNSLVEMAQSKRQLKNTTDRLAVLESELKISQLNEISLKNELTTLKLQYNVMEESLRKAHDDNELLKEQLTATKESSKSIVTNQDGLEKTLQKNIKDSKESLELISAYLLEGSPKVNSDRQRTVQDWCFLLHEENYISYRDHQNEKSQSGYNLPRLNEIRDVMGNEEHIPVAYEERFKKVFDKMEEMKFYTGCTKEKLLMKVPIHGKNLGVALLSSWLLEQRKKNVNCSYKSDEACIQTFSSGSNVFLHMKGWGNGNTRVGLQHPLKEETIIQNTWEMKDWSFSGIVEKDILVEEKFVMVVLTKN